MFGADYAKGPLVMGLSLSHSRGLGEYAGAPRRCQALPVEHPEAGRRRAPP